MDSNKRRSRKREALLAALQDSHDHVTADMLYRKLKPLFPEISLGTVYRNLGSLVADKVISSAGLVDGQERFEARTDPHSHFICCRCRRMTDLELPDVISGLYKELINTYGCNPEGYTLTITGLCAECRKNNTIHEYGKNNNQEVKVMKKWICNVCGNIFEGPHPPELCPVCKVTASHYRDAAEPVENADSPVFQDDFSQDKLNEILKEGAKPSDRTSRKWICNVCGNIFEGPHPPELCPVCKVTASHYRDAAEPVENADSPVFQDDFSQDKLNEILKEGAKPSDRASRKWICNVCGHIHEGPFPPELCPVCKVTASHFRVL